MMMDQMRLVRYSRSSVWELLREIELLAQELEGEVVPSTSWRINPLANQAHCRHDLRDE